MALHKDLTGLAALHQIAYHSETDPTTTLGPYKVWMKDSTGATNIRNAANSGWIPVLDATHRAASSGAHAASAISVADLDGNFTGTNAEAVLAELYADITAGSGATDLEGLTDVDLTSPVIRQGLFSDGTNFVNQFEPAHFVPPLSKTATFTALLSEFAHYCDASGGAFTENLPTAVGNGGKLFVTKKIDSSVNGITIEPNGAETIDGFSNFTIDEERESLAFYSDNANWRILAHPYGGADAFSVPAGGATDDVLTKDSGTSGDYSWQAPAGASSYRNLLTVASDVANTSGTYSDVTGLTFSVSSGTVYRFYAVLPFTSAANTTGSKWAVNGPSFTWLTYSVVIPQGTSNPITSYATTYDAVSATTATPFFGAGDANVAVLQGAVRPSASGTLAVRFATEVATSAITAKAGATLEWW